MVDTTKIREHMEVLAADGEHVGKVDHLEGSDQIKLAKNDPAANGKHHLVPTSWVDHVDAHVHLNKTANDVKKLWKAA
jgi:hypothetical protein